MSNKTQEYMFFDFSCLNRLYSVAVNIKNYSVDWTFKESLCTFLPVLKRGDLSPKQVLN